MAACDAQYCFTYVNIGNFGRISDGGVFGATSLARNICEDDNFLPSDCQLEFSEKVAPYVFVSDEAFPLQRHLMRPFPGRFLEREKRIFNYRLSRARRCIENAFGILSARWRVLRTTMSLSPENASLVTMACCCLHNFLMKSEMPYASRVYCPSSFSDSPLENGIINEGAARSEDSLPSISQQSIDGQSTHRQSSGGSEVRNILTDYFNNEGSVPWQDNV